MAILQIPAYASEPANNVSIFCNLTNGRQVCGPAVPLAFRCPDTCYRCYISQFATIASPLHSLLKIDNFRWTSACQAAFETLKKRLTTAPVLTFPDFTKTFYLQCDASTSGIGCVLSHKDKDKKDHPVAYASKALNKHQKNYSIIELELLAIIFGVEYFRPYLYGQKFVIQTDHTPLKYLQNMKNPTGRFARWIAYLQHSIPLILSTVVAVQIAMLMRYLEYPRTLIIRTKRALLRNLRSVPLCLPPCQQLRHRLLRLIH